MVKIIRQQRNIIFISLLTLITQSGFGAKSPNIVNLGDATFETLQSSGVMQRIKIECAKFDYLLSIQNARQKITLPKLTVAPPDIVNHGDATFETLQSSGATSYNKVKREEEENRTSRQETKLQAAKKMSAWLKAGTGNGSFLPPAVFSSRKTMTKPVVSKPAKPKKDYSDLMDFIEKTCKIDDKDIAENQRPGVILKINTIKEKGTVYIPVEKIAEVAKVAEATATMDARAENIVFKNKKGKVKMPLKSASIRRGNTLYFPISKLQRAFDASGKNIEALDDATVKVPPPFYSTTLLIGTTNPDLPTYGASQVVQSTKYFTAFHYNTLEEAQSAMEQLQVRADVSWVQFNGFVHVDRTDSDPQQISMQSTDIDYNAGAKEAIGYNDYIAATGGENASDLAQIVVAVVDSSFDSTDPLFDNRILPECPGWDVADNDATLTHPTDFHGTNVAGTVAQFSRPNVKIIPIKDTKDSEIEPLVSELGSSVEYAIMQGVTNVINMSFGFFSGPNWVCVSDAYNANVICVAGAGNEKMDAMSEAPANIQQTVTVGAINSFASGYPKASFTNFGEMVDTYAPGCDIWVPFNDGMILDNGTAWTYQSGTSFSSPIVAGCIADIMGYQQSQGTDYLNVETVNSFINLSNVNGIFNPLALNNMRFSDTFKHSGGTGTQNDPFIVTSASELQSIAYATYYGFNFKGYYFQLGNDITLSEPWIPIGYRSTGTIYEEDKTTVNSTNVVAIESPFDGTFDGNGKTITLNTGPVSVCPSTSNLDFGGIFGYVEGGCIKDLDVVIGSGGITTQSGSTDRNACFGSLVGCLQNDGIVERCSVSGGRITAGSSYITIGGLVGENSLISYGTPGFILNCYSNLSISGSTKTNSGNKTYVGGLIGLYFSVNNDSISNCYSTSSITLQYADDYSNYVDAGTLIGFIMDGCFVQSCYWKDYGSTPPGYTLGFRASIIDENCTVEQLRDPQTFTDWDFENIWKICPDKNNGYPILRHGKLSPVITPSAGSNGSISPNSEQTVNCSSDSQTFNFYPDTGYEIDQVLINGENHSEAVAAGSYTFTNVTENQTISVTFKKIIWQIGSPNAGDVVATFDNGTLTISGTGAMQDWIYNNTSLPWHSVLSEISSVIINDGVTTIGSYAFLDCSSLSSVTIPSSITSIGNSPFINCNSLTDITVNWETPLSINANVFAGIDLSNVNLHVPAGAECAYAAASVWQNFHIVGAQHTIAVSAGSGGSISPSDTQTVNCGGSQTFNFTPDDGYEIDQVLINGVNNPEAVAAGSYTFSNITENQTIEVTFVLMNDQCSNATSLSCGAEVTGTLAGATPTTSVIYDDGTDRGDVFYKFTADIAGDYSVTLTKHNIDDDINLYVYSDCDAATPLVKLIDAEDGLIETKTLENCTAGTTYFLRAIDWNYSGGSFDILLGYPQKSSDATLSSLTVDQGTLTPAFDANTLKYTVSVANNVTSTQIETTTNGMKIGSSDYGDPSDVTAPSDIIATNVQIAVTANNRVATVSGTGTYSLNVGDNTFNIVVTAEDGTTTNTYTVVVRREANCKTPPDYDYDETVIPTNGGWVDTESGKCYVYRVSVTSGTKYGFATAPSATYSFNAKEYLYDNTGTLIASSSAVGGSENLEYQFNYSGYAYVKIEGESSGGFWYGCFILPVIYPTAGSGGSIFPNSPVTVYNGNDETFAFTPNDGYETDQVLINGVNHPEAVAAGSYTFTNVTENQTISVIFALIPIPPTYGVSIGTFSGGSVSTDKTSAAAGETVTIRISPAEGYELDAISVFKTGDASTTIALNVLNAVTRTFTMPDYGVTVTATFKKTQEQLDKEAVATAKTAIEGRSYTVNQAAANTEATVKTWLATQINDLIAPTGITVAAVDITLNSFAPAADGANGSFNFTVSLVKGSATGSASKSGTISATLVYTVTVSAATNGSVSASKTTVAQGETVTLTISPTSGYELDAISVCKTDDPATGVETRHATSLQYEFTMPDYGVTVTATFKKSQATLDEEAVATAKTAIEGRSYTVNQAAANTEDAVKTWLATQINDLIAPTGITVAANNITISNFTPAADGANGSFNFTVSLVKGSATAKSASKSGTISATSVYTVTVSTATNGSVSASKTTVAPNETVTLTIAPAAGYELDVISAYKTGDKSTAIVLNVPNATTRTFTMPAFDVTITASFKKSQATLDEETVATAKTAIEGRSYTIDQAAANTEDAVKTWLATQINDLIAPTGITVAANNITISNFTPAADGANGSFNFTVSLVKGSATAKSASKSGTISAMSVYTVTVSTATNGSVSADKTTAIVQGETVTLTISPDDCYELDAISVCKTDDPATGVETRHATSLQYEFTMPEYGVTVTATFKKTAVCLAMEAAKAAIEDPVEGGNYSIAQATGNTAADVRTWLVNTLNVLFGQLYGVQFRSSASIVGDVTIVAITPAIAGTAANPEGRNGSFQFTVSLNKDGITLVTGNVAGVIIATPFNVVKSIELTQPAELNVRVTNTGNVATGMLTLSLSGANADVFTLPFTTINDLAVGGETDITIIPNTDLTDGTYTATLIVSGEELEPQAIDIIYNTTGIENVQQVKPLVAYIQNGTLQVSGLTKGAVWSVYNVLGTVIYRDVATDGKASVTLSARGAYVVQSGNKTVKVVY